MYRIMKVLLAWEDYAPELHYPWTTSGGLCYTAIATALEAWKKHYDINIDTPISPAMPVEKYYSITNTTAASSTANIYVWYDYD